MCGTAVQKPLNALTHMDRVDGEADGDHLDHLVSTDRHHGDPGLNSGCKEGHSSTLSDKASPTVAASLGGIARLRV
jgi:hypothetical protein